MDRVFKLGMNIVYSKVYAKRLKKKLGPCTPRVLVSPNTTWASISCVLMRGFKARMAPTIGLEPMTRRLTAACSTN